jgi:hypothetical protein
MMPKKKRVAAQRIAKALVIAGSIFACSPVRAADWGPLVEEIFQHLATHLTYEGAQRIIEHLTQGDRTMPTWDVTDEQLQKIVTDKLAYCLRRAQELDERDPQRRALLGKLPTLTGPGYAEERDLFRQQCKSVLPEAAN